MNAYEALKLDYDDLLEKYETLCGEYEELEERNDNLKVNMQIMVDALDEVDTLSAKLEKLARERHYD